MSQQDSRSGDVKPSQSDVNPLMGRALGSPPVSALRRQLKVFIIEKYHFEKGKVYLGK